MNTLILEVRDKAGDGGYPCALRLLVREGTQELMNFRLSARGLMPSPKRPTCRARFANWCLVPGPRMYRHPTSLRNSPNGCTS